MNYSSSEGDFVSFSPTSKVARQRDYDGDGKTDLAILRESDGTFRIFKSTTGTYGPTSWGYSTDLPIAAYDTQ